MKKFLLTSTAIAGMAFSGAAMADMSVGFGMDVGIAVIDDAGQTPTDRSVQTQQDFEFEFKASSELDNGMTIYADVEVDANNGQDTGNTTSSGSTINTKNIKFDDVTVGVKGSFGDFRFGNFAADEMVIGNPVPYNGTNDGKLSVSTPDTIDAIVGGDYTSIGYATPSIAGFKISASYFGGGSDDGDTQGADVTNADDEQGGIGVKYSGDFGGASVSAGASYVVDMGADRAQTNAGVKVGMAGFSITAAMLQVTGDDASELDRYAVGLGYATGPWSIDTAYTKETADGADDVKGYAAIAKYKVGPGLTAYTAIEANEQGSSEGTVGTLGLSFKF